MKSSQHAFTLLEALIVLSIISILAALSFPAFESFFAKTHEEILQAQILKAIHVAEDETKTKNIDVALCKSRNKICTNKNVNELMIFADEFHDGAVHDSTQIITIMQINLHGGALYHRLFPYYRNYFQFSPNLLNNDNGALWYCASKNKYPSWAIMLAKSGRTRVVYPDKNNEIKDTDGKLLVCV